MTHDVMMCTVQREIVDYRFVAMLSTSQLYLLIAEQRAVRGDDNNKLLSAASSDKAETLCER